MEIGDLFPRQIFSAVNMPDSLMGISQLLGRFNIGDEFKARILEIGSGELVMQLSDGSVMKAAFYSDMHLKKGDLVKLAVKGKTDKQLLLRTVEILGNSDMANETANETNDALQSKLMSIGINPDKMNLKIARELIKMHVVPDKEIMAKITESLKMFGGLGIKSAVFLVAKGIEPSRENVACLMRLKDVNCGIGQRIHELANSNLKEIADEINKLFINIESIDTKDLKNLDIKNIYRDILSKLSAIKEQVMASGMENKDALIDKIDNILNDLKVVSQLNKQNMYYIQIPVVLQQKHATCELYVLKRRKTKGKIDPGNTTMLISLDTENLGRIDSLVSIFNKNVALSFKVKDKNIMEFINKNTTPLYQRLTELGFRPVEIKCGIKTDDIDLTNVDETVEKEMLSLKRSIDCRV